MHGSRFLWEGIRLVGLRYLSGSAGNKRLKDDAQAKSMQKAYQVRSTYGGEFLAGQAIEQGASLRAAGAKNPMRAQED